ncbi:MAG: helix-turn-helix domain-containing protein [Oscillospiraceae bacterium]|nr:helix-turn-helix domain-containing protein [Oscillospiraceae bacterium]
MNKDYEIDRDSIGYKVKTLRERENLSQKGLAKLIHVTPSQISRLERGETTNVGTDLLVDIARHFKVSTDYLLGLTPIESQKSYDISRLGLSMKSVKRLMTHKIDVDVLNRLLEHERFPRFCTQIRNYFEGDMAGGYMSRNVLLDYGEAKLLSLKDNPDVNKSELKKDVDLIQTSKIGENEADIEKLKNSMLSILRDIKKEFPNKRDSEAATAKAVESIASDLSEIAPREVTEENVADSIMRYIERVVPMDAKTRSRMRRFVLFVMKIFRKKHQAED